MSGTDREVRAAPLHPFIGKADVWCRVDGETDRSQWHPLVQRFYGYWADLVADETRPESLPGRQHIDPTKIPFLLRHVWLMDVYRHPIRFRCRLAGTGQARMQAGSRDRAWYDEAEPGDSDQRWIRFRTTVAERVPTWGRRPGEDPVAPGWYMVESCVVPLARDGYKVDMLFGCEIRLDRQGQLLR